LEIRFIDIQTLVPIETNTLATIGFFDGVHRGHRFLIEQLKTKALQSGLKTAVITFPVHPRKVLQQDYQPKLLTSFEEKMAQLASTGVDDVYVMDFTQVLAAMSAQDFIQQLLRKQLGVQALLAGYDHRFGQGRTDSYEQYVAYGQACGMEVYLAEKLGEEPISSTIIRHLLMEGRVEEAGEKLSYDYPLEGKIIHGNHLGRTIGFPTANIDLTEKDKIIPGEGVYAARVSVQNKQYNGMAYIGRRPTVHSLGEQRIEVNIFDFDRDIYGEILRLELVHFIRTDRQFTGLEELKGQLAQDKIACINIK
jgi:riboflavin kinase/FMN adenylyltransferase